MSTQMSRQMSIKQAAAHFGVTDTTIRRRINAGKHQSHSPDETIKLQQSEINHLREILGKRDTQIKQLNHLLAMQSKQNQQLIAQLPPPRQTITAHIGKLFTKLSPNQT